MTWPTRPSTSTHRIGLFDLCPTQGLTGRVFQLWVEYGSGIGKNISVRIGYRLGTGIGIIYRANQVLSGIGKLDRVFFGYFFHATYFLYGMFLRDFK